MKPPPTPGPATSTSPSPLITVRDLSMTYRRGTADVHALREVSLAVAAGTFVALVGRSGAGKSTLLHLLAAMERPTAGAITVGPWHLAALDRKAQARYRREMVGMIFQQFNLIPSMTALQNVALPLMLAGVPPKARRTRALVCLEQVGLTHRTTHRPAELSGGEQQRVAIARALTADPPLLLADEPTGNLDSTTGARIVELLARVQREQQKTIIVVTHHLAEIEHAAGRVIELHDGRLLADDADGGLSAWVQERKQAG